MVAGADNYHAFIAGIVNLFYPVLSRGAIYLYPVLEKKESQDEEGFAHTFYYNFYTSF